MDFYETRKIVVEITGNYEKFMQGVSSNTLEAKKNAFLDKFGRIIVTFDQIKHSDKLWIIIEPQFYERMIEHLKPYRKLSKIKIAKLDKFVFYQLNNKELCVFDVKQENRVSEEEFNKWRLKNKIYIQGVDYDREMVLNVSEDFVSFSKGCYLGQEIVAKVKYKGKPPKKLVAKGGKFVFVEN